MESIELSPEINRFISKRTAQTEKMSLPHKENLPPRLRETAETLPSLTGTWNPVEIYTADSKSIEEEKSHFFDAFRNGEEYNPHFTYSHANTIATDVVRPELETLLHKIRTFPVDKNNRELRIAKIALYYKIKDDLATCDLIEGITNENEAEIKNAMESKYGRMETYFQDKALKGLEEAITAPYNPANDSPELKFLKHLSFTPEQTSEVLVYMLKEYGWLRDENNPNGFRTIMDENTTSIDVRDKSIQPKTIFNPVNRIGKPINGLSLLQLIGHEGEGHVLQSMNGEALFGIGGGVLKVDNETWYEGLAKRRDKEILDYFNETKPNAEPYFYPLAIATAQNGGTFYDIFQEQLNLRLHEIRRISLDTKIDPKSVTEEELELAKKGAWKTTYRVMRGHTDMSNPLGFAMTKDMAYLEGELNDQALQNKGLGYLNEAGILQKGGLQLLAEFNLKPEDLPYQYKHVWKKYWDEVLRPQMEKD
jgi:hypothetical protein